MGMIHVPVMLREVIEALKVKESGIYIDGTVGLGGHAEGILQNVVECTLIGIDQDGEAIEAAEERLSKYRQAPYKNIYLIRDNFSNMKSVVEGLGYREVNGIFLDLGVSSSQLKTKGRGFSFLEDEPLDMRMDRRKELTAAEIVNKYPEKDIAHILWQYGEERFCRRIAKAIVDCRSRKPINSCRELAGIIEKTIGKRGRIHPATKTFQALRIEVNKELTELSKGIDAGVSILKRGGRFCVLSYHSLEDRIVKNSFKKLSAGGLLNIISKKPLTPAREEMLSNPSSRSAKLRVGEKV